MNVDRLEERLDGGDVLILDGAMGTELQRRGVPMHGVAWSGAALLTYPDVVSQVHKDYILAGADVITTNTFATARHVLEPAGMGKLVRELNMRAVALARKAREEVAGDRQVFIAGSMSTFSPSQNLALNPTAQEAKDNYLEQAQLLAEAGVDLLILEMMRDVQQAGLVIESAISTGMPTWVGFSCELNEDGSEVLLRRKSDETLAYAIDTLMPLGGSLVSVMHTRIEDVAPALGVAKKHWKGPLGAYPHSGEFVMPNWQFVNLITPQEFVAEAKKWGQMGVQVIGGCCGLGPEYIQSLREQLPMGIQGFPMRDTGR